MSAVLTELNIVEMQSHDDFTLSGLLQRSGRSRYARYINNVCMARLTGAFPDTHDVRRSESRIRLINEHAMR